MIFIRNVVFLLISIWLLPACSEPSTPNTTTENSRLQHQQEISGQRQNAITKTVKEVSPAVVSIIVTEIDEGRHSDPFLDFFLHRHGRQRSFTSVGSGFIINEEGYVVTNEHVIGRSPTSIRVVTSGGDQYDAFVVGSDEYTDLALLKIQAEQKFEHVTFGDSDSAIVGEWVVAVGNPFGIFDDGQPSVTVGVVSAVGRNFRPNPQDPRVYLDMIQTDAAINRGNSGGPLVNSVGEVIGVNTFIFTGGTSAGFVGLSFAIPSNRVLQIIEQLAETGEILPDYDPGLEVVSINRRIAFEYRLPYLQGLLVVSVNQDGPAFEAGILPGDIITRVGNELIYGQTHAMALFREYSEGQKMPLEIYRDGIHYETKMLLRRKVQSHDF
ncbi:MAG: trypsin-like peptidase domain-containing protein [Balneolales bacterium]|nr:trypsin-like peptidase domain-containing protein [Balneolales bacterium]